MYVLILYVTYVTEQLCDILGHEAPVIHVCLILYVTYVTEQLCDILGHEAPVIHVCFHSICNLCD